MKSKEEKRIDKFVNDIQTENYIIKQKEVLNPKHINIDDFIEITFNPSQKDKEELMIFKIDNIGIMCILSALIFYFGMHYLANIGLWVLIVTIYLLLHLWIYKSKKFSLIKKMYGKCCICGNKTDHTPIYDSEDIELFFCMDCKKYVKYYHIWNRSV
jgi:hypothetical protein